MLVLMMWAALRRRPFSVLYTLFLVVIYAALLRVPIALSVLLVLVIAAIWTIFSG